MNKSKKYQIRLKKNPNLILIKYNKKQGIQGILKNKILNIRKNKYQPIKTNLRSIKYYKVLGMWMNKIQIIVMNINNPLIIVSFENINLFIKIKKKNLLIFVFINFIHIFIIIKLQAKTKYIEINKQRHLFRFY